MEIVRSGVIFLYTLAIYVGLPLLGWGLDDLTGPFKVFSHPQHPFDDRSRCALKLFYAALNYLEQHLGIFQAHALLLQLEVLARNNTGSGYFIFLKLQQRHVFGLSMANVLQFLEFVNQGKYLMVEIEDLLALRYQASELVDNQKVLIFFQQTLVDMLA